jgi:hypothetical protein
MVLRQFMKAQEMRRTEMESAPEMGINGNAFLILEDCVDQKFRFDTTVEELFYLGRHLNVAAFVASQWCHSLHPVILRHGPGRILAPVVLVLLPRDPN